MNAYVIGQIRITDSEKWLEYKSLVQTTLQPYGGKVLLRGNHIESFVGETDYSDMVIIEFESSEHARKWHNSDAYQNIVPIREKGAVITLHLYQ